MKKSGRKNPGTGDRPVARSVEGDDADSIVSNRHEYPVTLVRVEAGSNFLRRFPPKR